MTGDEEIEYLGSLDRERKNSLKSSNEEKDPISRPSGWRVVYEKK